MYKGLYTFIEAIARYPKGVGIFFKKECVVKIQGTKVFKKLLFIDLNYMKLFLFNDHNTLGTHKYACMLFDDFTVGIQDLIFRYAIYYQTDAKFELKKEKTIYKPIRAENFYPYSI